MNQRIFNLSDKEAQHLAELLYQKDYSSVLLSFIDNPARTLHYWSEEPNILPIGDEGGKRRKYSFFDLVWLKIVQELRDLGFQKPAIATLKGKLLAPFDPEMIVNLDRETEEELYTILRKNYGLGEGDVQAMYQELVQNKAQLERAKQTMLSSFIQFSIVKKKVIRFNITKDGQYFLYDESEQPSLQEHEEGSALPSTYVTLNLTSLLSQLLALPIIKDPIRQPLFTPKERRLIEELRSEGLKSATITYMNGEMELLELTEQKKVAAEARLLEVMFKNQHGKIELQHSNGKVLFCLTTKKIKL